MLSYFLYLNYSQKWSVSGPSVSLKSSVNPIPISEGEISLGVGSVRIIDSCDFDKFDKVGWSRIVDSDDLNRSCKGDDPWFVSLLEAFSHISSSLGVFRARIESSGIQIVLIS